MKNKLTVAILWVGLSVAVSHAVPWTYSGTGDWNPPAVDLPDQLSPSILTISMEAIASENPNRITLKIFSNGANNDYQTNVSGTYDVYRKDPDALVWGDPVGQVTVGTSITTWADTNVTEGVRYEYGLAPTGSISYVNFANANVIAGIKADCTLPRGRIAVVVTEDIVERLPAEYAQYKEDLVRDGWTVSELVVPRAPDYLSNGTGPNDTNGIPTGPFPTSHIAIRNQLISLYNTWSSELKNVVLVGKVPLPRSGDSIGPDGHGNRAATGADAYYADMDGVWTDVKSNTQYYASTISTAVKEGEINVAGDNKFDADYMYEITTPNSRLELGFGRIDFANVIPAEYEAMRNYFKKLHRYKTASPDFRPGRRAMHRGWYGILTHACLASMPGVVGMTNLDYLVEDDLPLLDDKQDRDSAYTQEAQPYLFYFKGNRGPGLSNGGRAVFWTGMQSHWGYWYSTTLTSDQNAMPRCLAEDNYTLSYTWYISSISIPNVSYLYHRLGMGGTAGDMMRVSMSERSFYNGYGCYVRAYNPMLMEHMGDPALRIFMFPPPTNLQVLPGSGNPQLSWTASVAPDGEPPVIGYHVYRSDNADGPFERLTTDLVAATSYTDTSVNSGRWYYQVKAVRLEPCGGGTFYNASLAAQQDVDLDGSPTLLAVDTSSVLPSANWDTDYEASLTATGGTPVYTWSTADALPAGLMVSADGVISGKPETNGVFNFTVQVTDALGQVALASQQLTVESLDVQPVFAEASGYVQVRLPDSIGASGLNGIPCLKVSGGPTHAYESYLKFDLSSVHTNEAFVQAKLRLMADGLSPSNSPIVVQAALVDNAGDSWTEDSLTYNTRPADNFAVSVVTATNLTVPHEPFELDLTDMVAETLRNDSSQILTVHLFSETPGGWGQEVQIPDRYACALAAPELIVQTTGTEGYEPPPPSAPVANFTADPVVGFIPLEVIFSDSSSGVISNRTWDFGDGFVTNTTETSLTHTYSSAGTYSVVLIATGPGGSGTSTRTDLVSAAAVPAGTARIISINIQEAASGTDGAMALSSVAGAPDVRSANWNAIAHSVVSKEINSLQQVSQHKEYTKTDERCQMV